MSSIPKRRWNSFEQAAYYELHLPGLGERFEGEVRRATEILLDRPGIGSPADPQLRRFALNRFPFTLYYSVTAEVLRIEVVAHQSRRPGYWQSRVGR